MTNHTKGPWELSEGNTSVWAVSPMNARVRIADVKQHSPMNGINNEANARLIATAPDLLEALEGLLSLHDPDGKFQPSHYKPFLSAAKTAIAKAKGETP